MIYRSALICCILGAGAAGAEAEEDLASRVVAMTGARTKIVWVHAVAGTGKGSDAMTPEYELKVFDTVEGKPRVLLPGPAQYINPCISMDGKVVFYNASHGKMIYRVNWDGAGKRKFTAGYALCTWRNPVDGTQWVYFSAGGYVSGPVIRARVDNPKIREVMWDKPSAVASHTLTVSADGTRAGGEYPWPAAGVAIMPTVSWKRYGSGCNASLAPDNSYRFMHMGEGAGHSGVMMYDGGGLNKRIVRFTGTGLPGRGRRDDCWVPRWSTDARFFTINSPSNGAKSEIYLGRFDDEFTRVVKWIRVTYEDGQDTKAACWIDPGLGQYFGEAPLTVTVPPKLTPGEWSWDYGDGTKETAASGKHTYRKLGAYTIVARQGKKVVKGWVNVQDRKGPTATGARLLDQKHVRVTFNERVQLNSAEVSLGSGRKVKGFSLNPDGTELTVELVEPLIKIDVLVLRGVFDLAASPNPMTRARVPVIPSLWPTNRGGLVLLWETARAPNIYYNARAKAFRSIDLNAMGPARPDRLGAMTFTGGLFAANDSGDGVVSACRKSGQLAIEATITPAAKQNPGGARILACDRRGGDWRRTNFALHQEKGELVLYLRTKTEDDAGELYGAVRRVELCALEAGKANHCVVSYRPGQLKCWLNGKPVPLSGDIKGALSWGRPDRKAGVHFGAVWGAEPAALPWRGKLEGVAIFSRAVDASQVAKDYAEYAKRLAARKPIVQVTIRGTLAAVSTVPRPRDIAPYHSALVVHEFDVTKVLAGEYADKKVRVARWGLIHRKKTAAGRAKPGERRDLVLEKFSDHPELAGELVSNTLPEDFDLDLYVEADATVKTHGPAATASPAKAKLGLARSYLAVGMKTKAKQILLDIVKNHPKSKQADQARELLKKLESRD